MQYHNLHLKQNEHSHSLIWWLLFEESTLLLAFYVKLQVLTKRLKFTVACLARMAGHRCKYLLMNGNSNGLLVHSDTRCQIVIQLI